MRTSASNEASDTLWVDTIDSPLFLELPLKVGIASGPVKGHSRRAGEKKMAGLARIVLYRRERPVVIEALGKGMLLTTLRYDHTVRQPDTVFDEIAKVSVDQEMTDLATHIIDKKKGKFDPSKFDDRYEDALLALIKSKQSGKNSPLPLRPNRLPTSSICLMLCARACIGRRHASQEHQGQRQRKIICRPRKACQKSSGWPQAITVELPDGEWARTILAQARLQADQRTCWQKESCWKVQVRWRPYLSFTNMMPGGCIMICASSTKVYCGVGL